MLGGWTLSVHHVYDPTTNTLFFGDGTQRNGYQIGTPVSFRGNRLVTSEDGTEIYVFDPSTGRHLETLKPLTGAIVYRFGYSGSGRLVTVTHASGNVTTIRRDGAGRPTAIVSPYGQRTTLAVDLQGFLSRLTDPLGHSTILVNTASGLLTSRTDAKALPTPIFTVPREGCSKTPIRRAALPSWAAPPLSPGSASRRP